MKLIDIWELDGLGYVFSSGKAAKDAVSQLKALGVDCLPVFMRGVGWMVFDLAGGRSLKQEAISQDAGGKCVLNIKN